ncbi:UBP-type zinc finger domain-containing protein [Streptomyces sp. WI03-4A]|uniref:UBP-type zinc finger domain-containing protein n=1 Tax=Streptomyces sp. WI03-4A TaxID=3028706 RepID=UPI0039F616A6
MTRWEERPDGGRPEGRNCAHAGTAPFPEPAPLSDACLGCAVRGRQGTTGGLRLCLTCGHVGCSDSSPGAHATAHHEATGHPLVRSAEPGESWAWCYVDEVFLRPRGGASPGCSPG